MVGKIGNLGNWIVHHGPVKTTQRVVEKVIDEKLGILDDVKG